MGRGPTEEYHKNMNEAYIKGTLTCLTPEYIKEKINTDFPLILNIEQYRGSNRNFFFCMEVKTKFFFLYSESKNFFLFCMVAEKFFFVL